MNAYEHYRPLMQTGDLIEWSPDTTIGRMIRWLTQKDVSHTSLIIRSAFPGLEEHVFILEAMGNGVRPARLSQRIEGFKGRIYWLPLLEEHDNRRNRVGVWAITTFVNQQPNYDYPGLFSNIISRVSLDGQRYYCSEWAQMAWTEAGIIPRLEIAVRPGEFEDFHVTGKRMLIYSL